MFPKEETKTDHAGDSPKFQKFQVLVSQRHGRALRPLPDLLCPCPAGMVLGTLFVGGSLVAGQQLRGGDLMSFLVASQTVQR